MTTLITATIVAVLPSRTNAHGDAENADVLARRLRWRGIEARVHPVEGPGQWPADVDAIVIGGATDSELPGAAAALGAIEADGAPFAAALAAGVPLLAVASGWELLGEGAELADGTRIAGLGRIAGRGVPRTEHAADDLVVDSAFGRLVGFENHNRDLVVDGGAPALGTVVAGRGRGDGREGLHDGALIATRMHGPVLARNPRLADHLLGLALERRSPGAVLPDADARTRRADEFAAQTRRRTLRELSLDDD